MMINGNLIGSFFAIVLMVLLVGCQTKTKPSESSEGKSIKSGSSDPDETKTFGALDPVGGAKTDDREQTRFNAVKPNATMNEQVEQSLDEKDQVIALNETQSKLFDRRRQLLFFIHRSKNENIVMYESEGDSNSVTGLNVRWKNLATDHSIERLSFLDRSVYGASLSDNKQTLKVSSLKKIDQPPTLSLKFDEALNRWTVTTVLSGTDVRLVRIWVEHSEGFIPTVYWIDLYGIDASDRGVTERFKINEKPEG